ncbi:hypothetical protein PGQ11_001351 [Apiospora arundinis]|uniref:Uncharacterized protein n=1 Tax=Apiospora arundinis TaxID=335852 RepID=A0ABR2JMK7_9PEZI
MPARNDNKTNGGGGGDRTGAKTDKEPPANTAAWYDWKIARVLAEAAIEKEAFEKYKALYQEQMKNIANLEAGKAAAEEKRRAELGGSKPQ